MYNVNAVKIMKYAYSMQIFKKKKKWEVWSVYIVDLAAVIYTSTHFYHLGLSSLVCGLGKV